MTYLFGFAVALLAVKQVSAVCRPIVLSCDGQIEATCAVLEFTNQCSWSDETQVCESVCSAISTEDECSESLLCDWDVPGECNTYDYTRCAASDNEFYECLTTDFVAQVDTLVADLGSDDLGADIVSTLVDHMLCSCYPLFFTCVYEDCAEDALFVSTCQATFGAAELTYGITCPDFSCGDIMSLSNAISIVADFAFSGDAGMSTDNYELFLAAIDAEIPALNLDWVTFDGSTVTVVIPEGTVLSATELEAIANEFEALTGSALMTPYGIEAVSVESEDMEDSDDMDSALPLYDVARALAFSAVTSALSQF